MVRTAAFPLLAALVLGGCDWQSTLERLNDDAPSSARSCEGVVCGPCAPAVSVRVTGGAGNPLPEGVVLSGIEGSCGSDGTVVVCSTHVHAPGDFTFEVLAPGYRTAPLEVMVPEMVVVGACCNCGYEPRVVDVTLERE